MRSEQEVRDSLTRISDALWAADVRPEARRHLEELPAVCAPCCSPTGDERLTYEPALVQVNAPLIQVELEARKNVLRWFLGLDPTCCGSAVPLR